MKTEMKFLCIRMETNLYHQIHVEIYQDRDHMLPLNLDGRGEGVFVATVTMADP